MPPPSLEAMEVDRNGLQVLPPDECLRLLSTATIGRVAITDGALPAVLPVNFHVALGHILIRTGAGSKLYAAMRNAVVAFEVDDIEPVGHTGWSVMVTGIARELIDPADPLLSQLIRKSEVLRIPRWAPHGDECIMAISIELISGRRILDGTPAITPGVL